MISSKEWCPSGHTYLAMLHHTYKLMHHRETHHLPWFLSYHVVPVICKRLRGHKSELIWTNEWVCAVWPFATGRAEVQTALGGSGCCSRFWVAVGCYFTDELCPKQDRKTFPPLLLPCFLPAPPCPQKDHRKTEGETLVIFSCVQGTRCIHTCMLCKQDYIKDTSHVWSASFCGGNTPGRSQTLAAHSDQSGQNSCTIRENTISSGAILSSIHLLWQRV